MKILKYHIKLTHKCFDLPSLEEQNKIVDFLLNIDHKIELSENQLNKTQEFKKGLLQQMFDNMLLFKL